MYQGGLVNKENGVIYIGDSNIRNNPNKVTRKKKLFFSSLNKTKSSQSVYNFSVNSHTSECKNIIEINPIRVNVTYVVPATVISNGFINFEKFDSECHALGNSNPYHACFPVTGGTVGNTVSFAYTFPNSYTANLKTPGNLLKELGVRLYKETSTGTLEDFTDASFMSMEVELVYQEHPFN